MQPTRALSANHKKNLLICLDAFGTLFTPKESISVTYARAAHRHGLPVNEAKHADKVMRSFKSAFKGEVQRYPNYGRSSGMGAERWWSNVIHNTFQPFLEPKERVPRALITELYQKFATKEAYSLYPDVKDFFFELQKYKISRPTQSIQWPFEKVIVGVVTNSDNRVPGILQSFGLHVAARRFGTTAKIDPDYNIKKDIDFVVMSYDVGHEKPDAHIFDAATSMLTETLASDNDGLKAEDFERLYVGDDLEKDFDGARAAGWDAVLLDRSGMTDKAKKFRIGPWGMDDRSGSERRVIAAKSLLDLYQWPLDPIIGLTR